MMMAEMLRRVFAYHQACLRVALPVKVDKYYKDDQTVDVKPLIKSRVEAQDLKTGGYMPLVESLPVIPCVPVVFPRAGGFFLSLPIKKGDTGLIVVCDWSIGEWFFKGGEVDPLEYATHHLDGAVFYPGLHDRKHAITDINTDNVVVGKDGGAQVHVKADEVDLYEENAADFVALAQKVLDELNSLKTFFDGLLTVLDTPVNEPGNGFPSAFQAAISVYLTGASYPTPSSVAAEKVKAT